MRPLVVSIAAGRPRRPSPIQPPRRPLPPTRPAPPSRLCASRTPRHRRPPRRRGVAGRRGGHQTSRSRIPTKASRRPSGPSCGSPTTTRRCTSRRGCTTASRRSSRAGCRAATTTATPTSCDFYLDAMHDHLTGAGFQISAAGVQRDAVLYNDSWDDSSWDSVWESAVSVDEEGWTAELRIPLSQLRFTFGERQTWGVNAMRLHPPQERARLARAGAEERERARVADGPPDRPRRPSAEAARRAAALHRRARRVRPARRVSATRSTTGRAPSRRPAST